MKKKVIVIFIVIALFALSACGNGSSSEKPQSDTVSNENETTSRPESEDGSADSVDEYNRFYDLNASYFAFDGENYYVHDGSSIYKILELETGKAEKIYEGQDIRDGLIYYEDNLFYFDYDSDNSAVLCSFDLKNNKATALGKTDCSSGNPYLFRCGGNIYCDPSEHCIGIDLGGSVRSGSLVTNTVWDREEDKNDEVLSCRCIGVFGTEAYLLYGSGSQENISYEIRKIDTESKAEEQLCSIDEIAAEKMISDFVIGYYKGSILYYGTDDNYLSSLDPETGQTLQYSFEFQTEEAGNLVITEDAFYFTRDNGSSYELCRYITNTGETEVIASLENFFYLCHAGGCLMLADNNHQYYMADLNSSNISLIEVDFPH